MVAMSRKLAVGLAGLLALVTLLAGCVPEGTAVARVVRDLFSGGAPLSAEARQELAQLASVVDNLSSPRGGELQAELEHFQDAFERVRED
jgi:hypothetical protein